MALQDTLSRAAKALESSNILFALIGGFALAAHGIVRATQDIDLLVDGRQRDLVKSALILSGFQLVHETEEVFHFSGPGQLDILLANRSPSQAMLIRATKINEFPVPVLRVEDIIGLKIQAYKNDPKREFQDKADIQALLELDKDLNFKEIKQYADLFDEWVFIEDLRKRL